MSNLKKKIVINPEEAEIIKRIFSLYLSGLGGKAIADTFNKESLSYRGKNWSKVRILEILSDESYIGQYYFNKKDKRNNKLKPKEEWILLPVDKIIDDDTFNKVQEIKKIKEPHNPKSSYSPSKTLLTGIAKCGICGAGMVLESAKGTKYIYYNCSNTLRTGKSVCPGQRTPTKHLDKLIVDHLANKLFTKERVREILKGVYSESKEIGQRNENTRKSLARKLEQVTKGLSKQYEAIESGIIDLKDVAERIRELKDQRSQIEEKLGEIRNPNIIPFHFFKDDSIKEFQEIIKKMFLDVEGNPELTKRYLKLFIEKIIIKRPEIQIVGKSEAVLMVLENKKALRTGEVLRAEYIWLPGQDSNLRQGG